MKDLTQEEIDDIGHTIKMMAELLNTLRQTRLISSFNRVAELSKSDHDELREAVRLVRGFLNNL